MQMAQQIHKGDGEKVKPSEWINLKENYKKTYNELMDDLDKRFIDREEIDDI